MSSTLESIPYIHRDISWLSFNYRVLQEAKDPSVPLFERIKFLGIYSSNLDEFFRVRVASLKSLIQLGKKTVKRMEFSPEEILQQIRDIVDKQQIEFGQIYKNQIIPQLKAIDISMISPKNLTDANRSYLDTFFEEKLFQELQPLLLVKNKIKTFLPSNAIYLAIVLQTKGNNNRYAAVRIPTHKFNRFIALPTQNDQSQRIIYLDDVVRYCLPKIFPGYLIKGAYSIKMTRDADIYIEDEFSGDLIEKIKKGIAKRSIGRGTRFVYDRKMPNSALRFFMETMDIKKEDLQEEGRYHNNFDLFKFPSLNLPKFHYKALPPLSHKAFHKKQDIFAVIEQKDQLLHFPYQKYDYVIRLLEQAARDPEVTDIKIAQYRVANDSQIIASLRSAIQEGKNVMVFMEVKARFDEEANLFWAEKLEDWGAKVIYSLPALKVHSKVMYIKKGDKEYAYLGTGNFNEDTAKIYSDFGFMTADRRLTYEVKHIFEFLEYKRRPKGPPKHLLVGQFRMRRNLYKMIENEIDNAKKGKKAMIVLKLNSLSDRRIIKRLYEASQAGVEVKLNIRGICSLVPNVNGFSENIQCISIVDRFLEHTRVYMFHNDGDEKIYLSSADWMTRNLFYRIECAFPIYDKDLKEEIKDFLNIQFQDNVKARIIDAKNQNLYVRDNNKQVIQAQYALYDYYKQQFET